MDINTKIKVIKGNLASLEAKTKEMKEALEFLSNSSQWKPSEEGRYCISTDGRISTIDKNKKAISKSGNLFKTKRDAGKAANHFTFYQRLYQLALDLNHKYEHTARYSVFWDTDNNRWSSQSCYNYSIDGIFTSFDSASEACEILEATGMEMPTTLYVVR